MWQSSLQYGFWVRIELFCCSTVPSCQWHNFVKCFSSDVTAQISPINFSGSGRVLKLSWEIWAVLPSAHSLLSHIIYSHLPHRGGPTFAKSSSSPPSASLLCDLSPSVQCIDFCLRTCKAAQQGGKSAARRLQCRAEWSKLRSQVIEAAFEASGQLAL